MANATISQQGRKGAAAGAGAGIRIGCGAGFANDRIDPAVDLARRGQLDFLFFEGLAERTLAHSQLARSADPSTGFNPHLERRLDAVLAACRDNGTRIVTNMGAANPTAAGQVAAAAATRLGYKGLRIAVVEGDNVSDRIDRSTPLLEGGTLDDVGKPLIGANAYLGADIIAEALDTEADIVITGRVADPALVLAPLIHSFGWRGDDWRKLGAGTLVGHLLECSAHVTGGCFADPGSKDVPNLAFIGYPLAEVEPDGSAIITKLAATGGCVTRATVLEQLFYEVHNPAAYVTPDVVADFSKVEADDLGSDRVRVSGAGGSKRPDQYKVTLGFDGGYLAEADIGYAGAGAASRARLAAAIVRERMAKLHGVGDLRTDLIGLNSFHATARPMDVEGDARDVRMRAALRTHNRATADALVAEVEALWIAGPAGGGGMRGRVVPTVMTRSALIDRTLVKPRITVLIA